MKGWSSYGVMIAIAFVCLFCVQFMDQETYADQLTKGRPAFRAAYRGDSSELADLIQRGLNINERDGEGNTALHWATSLEAHQRHPHTDHSGCARQFIAAGADPKAVNLSGETALYRAVWSPAFTRLLLNAGADPNQGAHTRTPLMSATYLGGPLCGDAIESMRLLMQAGANVNAQEGSGWSALTTAGIYGCPEMVEFLLASGADPNLKTPSGETVLATMHRYEGIAEKGLFTRAGRDVRNQNAALIRNAGGRE